MKNLALTSTFKKLRSWYPVPLLHGDVNRWGKNGNSGRFFTDSKITADSDFSHEINRCLLLGRKAMTNLDRILKAETSQRSIYSKLWFFQ